MESALQFERSPRPERPEADFRALFEAVTGLYLVLLPDDPTYTIVAVSKAYAVATLTKADEIAGRALFEVFPENPNDLQATGVRNLHASLRRVLATKEVDAMAVQRYDIRRPDAEGGGFEERYWSPLNSPVLNPDGSVRFIIHRVEDVTEFVGLKRAEAEVRRSDRRHVLLLRLMQAQRQTSDPEAIMLAASDAVGAYLNVDRVGFFEMRENEILDFKAGWTAGRLPLLTEPIPAVWIGARYLVEVQAGRTLGISDVRTDPLTLDSRFGEIGTVSLIGAPILRKGRWHAGLYVNHADPREWTDEEVSLVREVADLTWNAVERAEAEKERQKSEERLNFALEAGGGVGTWDWDVPGGRVYSNLQFARLFSVDPDRAVAGAPISEFLHSIHPDDRARVSEQIQRVLETGSDFAEEYRVVTESGSVRWIYARGRCHLDESGHPTRFPGVVFDITNRKRSDEQLRKQWHTFDTALSNTPDFTYIFDLEGRFTYVNRALLSLWQKSLEDALGKNFFDLAYPAELAERLQRQIQQVIDTRQPVRDYTPFTGPTGETRHYEYIFVPVVGANRQVEAVAGSTRDVTEQKKAEEQNRERQEQLREIARLESLGVMAGGIAHDFNNLLVGILGNASLLAETADERDRPLARDIVLAAERAADLTKQMLAFSGKGRFVVEVLDLNTFIRENLTLLRVSLSRSVTVELEFGCDTCFIEADRAQIQQVVMNLLINASEAAGDRPGKVVIRTTITEREDARFSTQIQAVVRPGRYVVLEVHDNGSGMSAETLKRIFDPFFTTKFAGRGLGLAAVLGIVRGHQGDIEVASQPGAGSTFRILLPASQRAASPRTQPETDPASPATGQSVLVVDDEEIVRRMASSALESRGFRVILATNGAEAIEKLRTQPGISLVILDLTMPIMTGEQAIPLMKVLHPNIPIILSSGFSEAEVSRRFASAGLAGFLQKPYTARAIASKVTHAIQNSAG